MQKIVFCKLKDLYGEFSNFYKSVMKVDNLEYFTVEHYYQSKKFEGTVFEDYVRHQLSPMKAKKLAYTEEAQQYFRPDWENIKVQVMAKGLFHKFQNPVLKNLLLSTEDAEIIEFSAKDHFWGADVGDDETTDGKNILGQMLMELRTNLKQEKVFIS